MRLSSLHFFPLTLPFVISFFLLVSFVIAVIEIGLLEYAYAWGVGLLAFTTFCEHPLPRLWGRAIVHCRYSNPPCLG